MSSIIQKGSRCRQEQIKSPSHSRPAAGLAFHHHPVHSSEPKAVQEHSLTVGSAEWCLTTLGVSSTLLQESKQVTASFILSAQLAEQHRVQRNLKLKKLVLCPIHA
ncbi:hypothetical protein SRHO_G00054890 [Serrasalmus rhombeus]